MIHSVQLLRAVACLLIVIDHLVVIMDLRPAAFKGVLEDAAFATDMFFVISGFIMWHVTARKAHDPLDLFVRRVIRIVPLYWLLTLVYLAAFTLPHVLSGGRGLDVAHVAASFAFIPYQHPIQPYVAPVIIPGHVLNHYMYFYLLFAVALALFANATHRFLALTAVIGAAAVAGLLVDGTPEVEFALKATVLEFVFGMGIAVLAARIMPNPRLVVAGLALLVGAIASMAVATWFVEPNPPVVRLFVFGLPAAAVVAAAVLYEKGRSRPMPRLVSIIGNASFSIYLTHIFTQTVVRVACEQLGINTSGVWAIPYVIVGFVLSVVGGILTYHAAEQPICNGLTALWERWRKGRGMRGAMPARAGRD